MAWQQFCCFLLVKLFLDQVLGRAYSKRDIPTIFVQACSQEGAREESPPGTMLRPPPSELSSLEKNVFFLALVFLFCPRIYNDML